MAPAVRWNQAAARDDGLLFASPLDALTWP
jgi:hypothetical protein